MPRSERCRIRGNCLHGIALPSLAQAPAADGAPGAAGLVPPTERLAMVERPGVGRLIGPGRAVERAWVRRPLAGFGRAVETRQRGSEDCGESVGRGQAVERQGRAERAALSAPFMGLRPAIGNFNVFCRPLRWPPDTIERRALGLWSKPNRLLWPLWAGSRSRAKVCLRRDGGRPRW
jgi:hypothetical protein